MRIGIDCRTILHPGVGEQAGIGHYTYYLVKNLLEIDPSNNYVLFFDNRFKDTKEFEKENVEIKHFPFCQYKKYLPITYAHMLVSAFLNREKLDLFHSTAKNLPLSYRRPAVVTIHDLAVFKHPELFPKKFLNKRVFSNIILAPQSVAKAKKIIAMSKNTKTDVIESFNVPDEKIEVIYSGVNQEELDFKDEDFKQIKKKYGIAGRYILFLGTIEPRKNLVELVKAFRNLSLVYDSPLKGVQLVIAGASGFKSKEVGKVVADANASILGKKYDRQGLERRQRSLDLRSEDKKKKQGERRKGEERRKDVPIKHIGYVPYEDKMRLLKGAMCFIFPSLYEGFGLSVLEAMSHGVPTITSNLSALPEVVGENGAMMVDPYKESEISDAIYQIVTDDGLRESLSINGRNRSREFGWDDCAQKTLDVYRAVIKKE